MKDPHIEIHICEDRHLASRALVSKRGNEIVIDSYFPNRAILDSPGSPTSRWWSDVFDQVRERLVPRDDPYSLVLVTRTPGSEPEIQHIVSLMGQHDQLG